MKKDLKNGIFTLLLQGFNENLGGGGRSPRVSDCHRTGQKSESVRSYAWQRRDKTPRSYSPECLESEVIERFLAELAEKGIIIRERVERRLA